MAGIEKTCEVCGEHKSWDMYAWKHNHIQICPEHRKDFIGLDHKLTWYKEEFRFYIFGNRKSGSYISYKTIEELDDDWIQFGYHGQVAQEWRYELEVFDKPSCAYKGLYINWTVERGAVRRKLKRMFGGFLNESRGIS